MKKIFALISVVILIILSYAMAVAAQSPSNVNVVNIPSVNVANASPIPVISTSAATTQLLTTTSFVIGKQTVKILQNAVDVGQCSSIRFSVSSDQDESSNALPIVCELIDVSSSAIVASATAALVSGIPSVYNFSVLAQTPSSGDLQVRCYNTDQTTDIAITAALYCR